jgi:phosphonate ABC transporter permease subunit PhnE
MLMMNGQPPSLQTAVRTLLLILVVVGGVLIYAYGWNTTDVNLDTPRDPARQESVKKGLRDVLSPNIFDQELTANETAYVNVQRNCILDESAEQPDPETGLSPITVAVEQPEHGPNEPYVVVTPDCGEDDEPLIIKGYNFEFHPRNIVTATWIAPSFDTPLNLTVNLRRDGTFETTIPMQRVRGSRGELHQIEFAVMTPTGSLEFSDTSHTVFEKMIETVFLALIATSLAVPIAVTISFFAARNLMRQVSMPVGDVLVSLALFPIGWILGSELLGPIGTDGVRLGQFSIFHLLGERIDLTSIHPIPSLLFPIMLIAAYVYGADTFSKIYASPAPESWQSSIRIDRWMPFVRTIVMLTLVIFSIGALGGFLKWIGDEAAKIQFYVVSDILDWIGNRLDDTGIGILETIGKYFGPLGNKHLLSNFGMMVGTIGEMFEILVPVLASLAIGAVIASAGSRLSVPVLKPIHGIWSHIIGGVLGAIVGAIMLWVFTFLSMQAALLIILPPLIAVIMAWQIFERLYWILRDSLSQWIGKRRQNRMENLVEWLIQVGGTVAVFLFASYILNVERGIFDEKLPLRELATLPGKSLKLPLIGDIPILGSSYRLHLIRGIELGAVLGALNGLLVGIQTTMPFGLIVYNTTRTILNILRSIEPLMMGIVFVIWVGIGPFAGVLALTLHSVAALGKLYSEQVENIDAGPIEALQSTGANRLQTIIYAVVPQIVPPYIAFTMYRWDINVRMSTIIGFVGGGGIGFVLQQQLNLLQYKDAGVAILAIAFVVSVLDYTSAYIREKVT